MYIGSEVMTLRQAAEHCNRMMDLGFATRQPFAVVDLASSLYAYPESEMIWQYMAEIDLSSCETEEQIIDALEVHRSMMHS